jgi:hypothetical protein
MRQSRVLTAFQGIKTISLNEPRVRTLRVHVWSCDALIAIIENYQAKQTKINQTQIATFKTEIPI